MNELGTSNVSAAVFGNTHMAVILCNLGQRDDTNDWPVTTRRIAAATGLADSIVRAVLLRLVAAGVLVAMPKDGGLRGQQFFDRAPRLTWWSTLIELAKSVADATPPIRLDTYGPANLSESPR